MTKTLGVLAIIIVGFGVIYSLFVRGWLPNYSEGQRTGEVYKFSKKGVFYKSWEGSMYLGGAHVSGGENSTLQLDTFEFSIPVSQESEKKEVIGTLNECASKRKTCTVFYKQWFKSPINIETSYVVEKVVIEN